VKRPHVPAAALAGTIGALIVSIVQAVMAATGSGETPTGNGFASIVLGLDGWRAVLVGLILFLAAGAVLGAVFGAIVPRPGPLAGLLYGLVPMLVVVYAVQPAVGRGHWFDPATVGLSLAWGAFLGAVLPGLIVWDTLDLGSGRNLRGATGAPRALLG
jgi:hypothetical protein